MDSTIVGMFDSKVEAENAREQLVNAGIAPAAISLHAQEDVDYVGNAGAVSAAPATQHEGALAHFFHSLFGDEPDDVTGVNYRH